MVTKSFVDSCDEDVCTCERQFASCLFGPDSRGQLIETSTTYDIAANCDRQACVCSTHDGYKDIWRERLIGSKDQIAEIKDNLKEQACIDDPDCELTNEQEQPLDGGLIQKGDSIVTAPETEVKSVGSESSSGLSDTMIAIIAAGAFVFILLVIVLIACCLYRRLNRTKGQIKILNEMALNMDKDRKYDQRNIHRAKIMAID